jgi:hypothetical protein
MPQPESFRLLDNQTNTTNKSKSYTYKKSDAKADLDCPCCSHFRDSLALLVPYPAALLRQQFTPVYGSTRVLGKREKIIDLPRETRAPDTSLHDADELG